MNKTMADDSELMVQSMLDDFRHYPEMIDAAKGTIEWRYLCAILGHLDPAFRGPSSQKRLYAQIMQTDEDAAIDPVAAIPLKLLYDFSPTSYDHLEVETDAADVAPDPEVVRIRKATGDVALTLMGSEVHGLSIGKLKAQLAGLTGRQAEEVNLLCHFRILGDKDLVEELLSHQIPVEVQVFLQQLPEFDNDQPAIEQLPILKRMLHSGVLDQQLFSVLKFRSMLSTQDNPPIDQVISVGVVPRMLELCQDLESPRLQHECLWALTNIASGTSQQTRFVIDCGAVPVFVTLLASTNDDVCEQAVWALGNIAGDSPQCRDLVLVHGAIRPMVSILVRAETLSKLRNTMWAVSNLCRGKPVPDFERMEPAVEALPTMLGVGDDEALADACWAASYLSDGPDEKIAAVLETGVCPRLVELLSHPNTTVQVPALRSIGNIVSGNDQHTDVAIRSGCLAPLQQLLVHTKRSIRKESCWAASNIVAGTRAQIQAVIDAALLPLVLQLLETDGDVDIQKEAAWVIANSIQGGSLEQIRYLVDIGCVEPLVGSLRNANGRVTSAILDGLKNLLQRGDAIKESSANPFVPVVRNATHFGIIERVATEFEQGCEIAAEIVSFCNGRRPDSPVVAFKETGSSEDAVEVHHVHRLPAVAWMDNGELYSEPSCGPA